MNELIKILKVAGIATIILGALYSLGSFINNVIPWHYLVDVFSVAKVMLNTLDWFWDTTALLVFLTAWLVLYGAVWGFRGVNLVIKWFRR